VNEKIAIIYTTFLRDWLVKKTIISIFKNWQYRFTLFIGDQGREDYKEFLDSFKISALKKEGILWATQTYDCGVSLSRNDLIDQAAYLKFKYCLLTADSIQFIPETVNNLDKAVQFLENHSEVGILGFDLKDRIPWEYFMDIKNNSFLLTKTGPIETDPVTGLHFKRCDICRQFFLTKIDSILAVKWDEQLKTGDHEDFFWRYKQAGYKVCWTPDISGQYIDYKPEEYLRYRNRQYKEFRKILFKKHNLNNWIEYA
jgi:hypothetical protein